MMKRTRDLKYRPADLARSSCRKMYSASRNRQDIYFADQARPVPDALTRNKSDESSVKLLAPSTPLPSAPLSTARATGPLPKTPCAAIVDVPIKASDAVGTIVSIGLKRDSKELSMTSSVKSLSGGWCYFPCVSHRADVSLQADRQSRTRLLEILTLNSVPCQMQLRI